jgi:hypothetical protein
MRKAYITKEEKQEYFKTYNKDYTSIIKHEGIYTIKITTSIIKHEGIYTIKNTITKIETKQTKNIIVHVVVNTHTNIKQAISNQKNTKHISINKQNNNLNSFCLFKDKIN